MRPLSADLALGCQEKQYGYFESTVRPPFSSWHIRALPTDNTAIEPLPRDTQCSETPQLTPEVLSKWISQALDQDCGCLSTTHRVDWKFIEFLSIQAKLPNIETFSNQDSLRVGWKNSEFTVPITRENDQLWVFGTMFRSSTYPAKSPFYVIFSQECGRITLDIQIYWSLWTHPNSAGYPVMYEIIQQLLQLGWQASYLPTQFKADFR
jgi:hypothetical protein